MKSKVGKILYDARIIMIIRLREPGIDISR